MPHARTAWLNAFLSGLCWLIASAITYAPEAQAFAKTLITILITTTIVLAGYASVVSAASPDHWLNKSALVHSAERAITIVLLVMLFLGTGG